MMLSLTKTEALMLSFKKIKTEFLLTQYIKRRKPERLRWTAPKSLDEFIIKFDNNEFDIVSGSFLLD
jgi:hypothetical protein